MFNASPNPLRSAGVFAFVMLAYFMGVGVGIVMADVTTVGIVRDWQTLIGAFAALIAAIIGAWYLQKQIKTARAIEDEKRWRKVEAARSVLPEALSELAEYSRSCGKRLARIWDGPASPATAKAPPFPPFPSGLLPLFKEIVEHAPLERTQSFRSIIMELQVLNANLRGGFKRPSDRLNAASYAARCAYLHALTDKLFPYARFEDDDPTRVPALKDVEKALLFFGFHKEIAEHDQVFRLAAKKLAGPEGPAKKLPSG